MAAQLLNKTSIYETRRYSAGETAAQASVYNTESALAQSVRHARHVGCYQGGGLAIHALGHSGLQGVANSATAQ